MIKDYKGPSNSSEILAHLVEETIQGAFQSDEGYTYLVLSSGDALVFANASYWKESQKDVERVVRKRQAQIQRQVNELGRMTALVENL